jgi:hypothetical protein
MSDESIRLKMKEIIERVPGCGFVHDYERWSTDWNKFIALFKDPASSKILGWEISRRNASGTYISNSEEEVSADYIIHGYMGVQDADRTDIKFNALIDALRDQFKADMTLGGLNQGPQGFNCGTIEPRSFGSVLCHYCEITIPVTYITF